MVAVAAAAAAAALAAAGVATAEEGVAARVRCIMGVAGSGVRLLPPYVRGVPGAGEGAGECRDT